MSKINQLQRVITVSSAILAGLVLTAGPALAGSHEGAHDRFVLSASQPSLDGNTTLNARLSMVRDRPCNFDEHPVTDDDSHQVAVLGSHDEYVYAESLAVEVGQDKIILPFSAFSALFDAADISINGNHDDFIVTVTGDGDRWIQRFHFVDGWPTNDPVPPRDEVAERTFADRGAPAHLAAARAP